MVMGNGCLAGLVAITAGCSVIYPWGAVLVGGFAGFVYNFASWVSLKMHVRPQLPPSACERRAALPAFPVQLQGCLLLRACWPTGLV